jgi:hypothetical protein
LEARRGALLAVLSSRFGRVERSLEARILRIEDSAILETLIKRAAVVSTPREFSSEVP